MDKPMPDWIFRSMIFLFKIRDSINSRDNVLEELDLQPGQTVLDFGCGTGVYSLLAAQKVGPEGKVFALDIHPLAIERIQQESRRMGLKNVTPIHSGCATNLPDESTDVILLYDIFHLLSEQEKVLQELHRVIKPGGVLSFNDHHMRQDKILAGVTNSGLFKFAEKKKWNYYFEKK